MQSSINHEYDDDIHTNVREDYGDDDSEYDSDGEPIAPAREREAEDVRMLRTFAQELLEASPGECWNQALTSKAAHPVSVAMSRNSESIVPGELTHWWRGVPLGPAASVMCMFLLRYQDRMKQRAKARPGADMQSLASAHLRQRNEIASTFPTTRVALFNRTMNEAEKAFREEKMTLRRKEAQATEARQAANARRKALEKAKNIARDEENARRAEEARQQRAEEARLIREMERARTEEAKQQRAEEVRLIREMERARREDKLRRAEEGRRINAENLARHNARLAAKAARLAGEGSG